MTFWTETQIEQTKKLLSQYTSTEYSKALKVVQKAVGRPVTPSSLRHAFLRWGLGLPTSYLKNPTVKTPASNPSKLESLLKFTKKTPVSFSQLCDKLDMSPSKVKSLVEEAKKRGLQVHVEHDHVGIKTSEPSLKVQSVGIPPVVGERQRIAVISDTHLGSKFVLRSQLKEFIHYAYSLGIREILHPGDLLDGMYKHGIWEVSHSGLEAQAEDLFNTLPCLPGLNYRCITGNHDFTFSEGAGLSVGQYLRNYFLEKGRSDLHFYGDRSAHLKVKGAHFHLWHPKKGCGYAKSYGIQKQIEKYSSGCKPQVTLIGHWHIFTHIYERGIHGIACPTFQGGGSAFGKSLGGAPAIGGLILSWDLTAHGTMRAFNLEYRSYFEVEKPQEVGTLDAENPIE